jgi:methylthioribulose-1-phosphate dehydratase
MPYSSGDLMTEASSGICEIAREFHARGWMLGTSGNLSAVVSRDPLRLAITASGLDKGRLQPDHILEIGFDGQPTENSVHRPSDESLLHVEIVLRRRAGAVLHTHSIWSTILSERHAGERGFAIEGYEMLKGLDGVKTHRHREWLPIIDNAQDMRVLAEAVSLLLDAYPGAHGFLLRRHGLYVWGKNLIEAKRHLEIIEFLLEAIGRGGNYGDSSTL